MPRLIEGEISGKGITFAIVISRFNEFISQRLLDGALDALKRHGASDEQINIFKVPGAFEIPLAVQKAALSKKYDAIIAIGSVIRGGTPHFEYVAGECVKGLAQVMMQNGIPVAFGVLTVDTIEQAIERAGTKAGNKGVEAAMSAIEMVNLLKNMG